MRLPKIKSDYMRFASAGSLVVMVAVFYFINPSFLNLYNIKVLLLNIAPLLVMSCGATYVRLLGSLDLSMGAVCSCANVMFVELLPNMGALSYAVAIVFGIASGLLLGFIHTRFKIPSFIASLGMMNVYNSIALLIAPSPVNIERKLKPFISWGRESVGIIGVTTIISVVIMILLYFLQKKTTIGKTLNLIGANERAARISGVRVTRSKLFAFAVCGMTSAIAGIMLAIKLQSSAPTVGSPFTLLAVAAVLLGGTSMTGGKGSILMTLIGVLMVVVIDNGMTIVGVDPFWSQIIFGVLIIIAMTLTTDRTVKNSVVK